jgi:Uma2 family endonuclease
MSYEEYLAWAPENMLAEWKDGEVTVAMPPKDEHQRVLNLLNMLMGLFAGMRRLGAMRVAPLEVHLGPQGPSREPDLFFVAQEHLSRLGVERFEGAPDLVVEVISGDSVTRDRRDKWGEYQAAGVREYWIVDPRPGRRQIDVYRLDEAGRYALVAPDAGGTVHSTVLPGFWLRAEWLWSEPEPLPLALLATILGHPIEVRPLTTDE